MMQFAILLATAVLAWFALGEKAVVSLSFGAMASLGMTLLMLVRQRQSEAHSEWDARRQLGQFFRLEAERFLFGGSLLALGFLSGNTAPQLVIAGFVLGQFGWLAALKK